MSLVIALVTNEKSLVCSEGLVLDERDRFSRRIASLQARRLKLLDEMQDPERAGFTAVREIDSDLEELDSKQQWVGRRLAQIQRWRDWEIAEKRQAAERAARQEAARERREKIAKLDRLARETSAAWQAVVENLAALRSGAREVGEVENRWLGEILSDCSGKEIIAPVAGLPAGSWLFPPPGRK